MYAHKLCLLWHTLLVTTQNEVRIYSQIQAEKMSKSLESQLQEMNSKLDESTRTAHDLTSTRERLAHENADVGRQLEDAESQLNQLNKQKQALTRQMEELRANLEEESRLRSKLQNENRNLQVLVCVTSLWQHYLRSLSAQAQLIHPNEPTTLVLICF